MAKSKIVPIKEGKEKALRNENLHAAIEHMDEMTVPLGHLCGLLRVLINIDTNQDGPEPEPLFNTFDVLSDLAEEVKEHHEKFWVHYERTGEECVMHLAQPAHEGKIFT